jgi:carboxypeptidase C (cathepsin A)
MRQFTFAFIYLFSILSISHAEEIKKPDEKKNLPIILPNIVKSSSVLINGETINYESIAGKILLKKDDGTPRASIFHVSYIRKDVKNPITRPVMFAFNGGPGSSSVWLHLGALGPRILNITGDGTQPIKPPATLINNTNSILDATDLVFIDPVSTGYSRAEKDIKPSEFHGVNDDIASIADFIRLWVTQNKRWASPKFLLGESYGGIRAAGLANELQSNYGMQLNGVVMLSTLLDFQTLSLSVGNELPFLINLPTFTSVAHFHGVIKGDRNELVKQSRAFAFNEYATALHQGNELPIDQKKAIAEKLASLTGLSVDLFREQNLRITPARFRGEILKSAGKNIGRFDARVTSSDTNVAMTAAEYDASYSLAFGAFSTAMLDYLTRELDWKEDQPYEILTEKVQPWNWNSDNSFVNLSPSLSTAIRDNPHLRVLVQCGYTDLATPSDGMLYSVRHMLDLPENTKENITFEWYEGGHMFYLNPPDLKKMRDDLIKFINQP